MKHHAEISFSAALRAAFLAVCTVLLCACPAERPEAAPNGSDSPGETPVYADPSAPAAGVETPAREKIPIKVVYFDTDGEENGQWLASAAAAFELSHPSTKVILSPIYGTESDYADKISLMLKGDPSIDVIMFDSAQLSAFVTSGYLVGFMADTWHEWIQEFPGNTKKTAAWQGLEYAMPFSLETCGLFYNKDAFRKAGIRVPWRPNSWEEITDATRRLRGTAEYPFWVNGSAALGEATTFQTFEMLLSGTHDWLYEDDTWMLSSPGMLDVLNFLYTIYQEDGSLDSLGRAVMMGRHSIDTIARKTLAGEIGIALFSCRLGAAFERNDVNCRTRIGLAPLPRQHGAGYTSVTGSWMLGISSLSAHKFIGFEFLKSALSQEAQLSSAVLRGDLPVRRDTGSMPEWKESNGFGSEMSDYLYFSRFRPSGAEYPQISKQAAAMVEAVIMGTKKPAEALADFTASMKKILPDKKWIIKPIMSDGKRDGV